MTEPLSWRQVDLLGSRSVNADFLAALDAAINVAEVVNYLVEEVSERVEAYGRWAFEATTCLLQVSHSTEVYDRFIVVQSGRVEVSEASAAEASCDYRISVEGLWNWLFGQGGVTGGTRSVSTHGDSAGTELLRRVVGSVERHNDLSLTSIGVALGTDKWGFHWYTDVYETHLKRLRDHKVRILEIGTGGYTDPKAGGESLRMWKNFFRRGYVVGVDLYEKNLHPQTRVTLLQGDQTDSGFLTDTSSNYGPFDVIIDDGSHFSPDIVSTLSTLFPLMADGGVYIVEDTQTSYWPGWGGSEDLGSGQTSMGFLKKIADGLNFREWSSSAVRDNYTELYSSISSIHFYHNVAIIEKRENNEAGAPEWVPRDVDPRTVY